MRKIKDIVIYQDEGYNTFPSIVLAKNGDICVAFRHAPDRRAVNNGNYTHIDPEAVGYLVRSTDGGATFGKPEVLYSQLGRSLQDPYINLLQNGDILMSNFFWNIVDTKDEEMVRKTVNHGVRSFQKIFDGRTSYVEGSYSMISRDNGKTFEGSYCIDSGYACRGQCAQLPDGTILAPLYGNMGDDKQPRVVIFASRDGGKYWEPYSFVWQDPAQEVPMHEPTLFRTAKGTMVCFIRTPKALRVSKSMDDGRTWSEPVITDIPSNVPYHALQLQSGNVLLTYGLREKPFGIRALLLDGECNGVERSREFVVRDDAPGADVSYNSAIQMPNGDILAVYYYHTNEFEQRRHIAGTWLREE